MKKLPPLAKQGDIPEEALDEIKKHLQEQGLGDLKIVFAGDDDLEGERATELLNFMEAHAEKSRRSREERRCFDCGAHVPEDWDEAKKAGWVIYGPVGSGNDDGSDDFFICPSCEEVEHAPVDIKPWEES